jgi:hypothetical protein
VIPFAYSAGKPVVATKVGGLPEMVEHDQTGFLVAPRDVTGLAESITRLLLDAPLRHRMGANAKRKIETECSPSTIAQRTMQVYRRTADGLSASREQIAPGDPASTSVSGSALSGLPTTAHCMPRQKRRQFRN